MPDDNAGAVSFLLEWIYTGHTKHSRLAWMNAKSIHERPEQDVFLELGKFYIVLAVVGCKYDCQPLLDKTNDDFRGTVTSLDAIEQLRLWTLAYSSGPIRFPDYSDNHKKIKETRDWVQLLCTENKEELIQALSRSPGLAYDLLHVTSSTSFMENHM